MTRRALSRDPEGTRCALLDAAERLFANQGFDATALSDVAEAAGVTKSLIHHHFGSKDQLLEAVAERRFASFERRQKAILDREDLDLAAFEESMCALFGFLARNPEFVRLRAWANAAGRSHETGSELTRRGVARMREMQERGEVRADVDPASILTAFFGLIEHWFQARPSLAARFDGDLPKASTYLDDVVRILIRGIRS